MRAWVGAILTGPWVRQTGWLWAGFHEAGQLMGCSLDLSQGCSLDLSLRFLFKLGPKQPLMPQAAPDASLLAAPPQFLETPPQVLEVRELEPVTLRCVARGSPQPRVTWKLRGRDLGQGQSQVQVSSGTGQGGPDRV